MRHPEHDDPAAMAVAKIWLGDEDRGGWGRAATTQISLVWMPVGQVQSGMIDNSGEYACSDSRGDAEGGEERQ